MVKVFFFLIIQVMIPNHPPLNIEKPMSSLEECFEEAEKAAASVAQTELPPDARVRVGCLIRTPKGQDI